MMDGQWLMRQAHKGDLKLGGDIAYWIADGQKSRKTGRLHRRSTDIEPKLEKGQAILGFSAEGELAGYVGFDLWDHDTVITSSGLIVLPSFRGMGLGRALKEYILEFLGCRYPNARLFTITTNLGVLKMNREMGYQTDRFEASPRDPTYWKGCMECPHFKKLREGGFQSCLCHAQSRVLAGAEAAPMSL